MKLVLLCFAFDTLQYRVLRCAADVADAVYVLGPASARRLAASRFCSRFILAASLDGWPELDRAREEIEAVTSALDVHMVVPGDGRAVRLLSELGPLRVRTYPVPDLRTFDLLDDKWRFGELCRELGVRHPPARLFRDRDALLAEFARGAPRLPIVIKPTTMAGGRGVHVLRSAGDLARARHLTYSPILAQPYVDGTDVGLSAFCRGGQIVASVVHRRQAGNCIFTTNAELLELTARILRQVNYDGVANFDARLDRSGLIHMLECNPRFWFTMDMSLLAGLNFVSLGLEGVWNPPRVKSGTVLKSNRSLLRTLGRPWTLTAHDLATLWFRLRDPIPPLYDLLDRRANRR